MIPGSGVNFARMNRKAFTICTIFIVMLMACHSTKTTTGNSSSTENSGGRYMDNFTYLKRCMQGNFSSMEQSQNDSDFFDIRLRMVPIWKSTPDDFYLYVEQAMSTAQDKPYRQRAYHVVKVDETHFNSYIYMLPQPERFIGKKENDPVFNTINPDSLKLKDGCEVHLTFNTTTREFEGSTGEKTCPSDRSGAAWATSKVQINDQRMISWDQGWNTEGKQVWGAVKGGYIFKKSE
jgi:hypothetical protein